MLLLLYHGNRTFSMHIPRYYPDKTTFLLQKYQFPLLHYPPKHGIMVKILSCKEAGCMKTIQFKDLHKIDFDLHKIIIVHHFWRDGEVFPIPQGGRVDNGIMFLVNCSFEYLTSDGEVYDHAPRESIVYAPKGSEYICRFNTDGKHFSDREISDFLINFILTDESGKEFILADDRMVITTEKAKYYSDSFARIDALGRKGISPSARIKAMLYDLLCDISQDLQKSDIMSRSYASIYPAIRYIRTTDLAAIDTASLADRCHISPSCFRRLFRDYTGMAPLEYVNHLKIKQAQKMLQSGVLTVTETAESLGYADASYFSRFYKKITGHSPSEDRR